MADMYIGDFALKGTDLRRKGMATSRSCSHPGINRIGNLLIANENYGIFEEWLLPILDEMLEKQKATGKICSPSKLIKLMGKKINNEDSIYYWCWKVMDLKGFLLTVKRTKFPLCAQESLTALLAI
jgi:deoxyhypusine synthase